MHIYALFTLVFHSLARTAVAIIPPLIATPLLLVFFLPAIVGFVILQVTFLEFSEILLQKCFFRGFSWFPLDSFSAWKLCLGHQFIPLFTMSCTAQQIFAFMANSKNSSNDFIKFSTKIPARKYCSTLRCSKSNQYPSTKM